MAASDLIAAAIAAFVTSHPSMTHATAVTPEPRCMPAAVTASARPDARRMPLGLGCGARVPAAVLALDIAQGWIARAETARVLDGLAAQPRVAVAVTLLEPVARDPLEATARAVIGELHARNPAIELDTKQLVCLQRALYFEARGEGSLGLAAVAHVALNRVGTRPGRATVCDVVREPGQFAPYLAGEPDEADLAQTDEEATRAAIEAAAQVMAGYIPDPSRGGQYFYAPRILKAQPAWAKGLKETARVGGHRFFAEPIPALATRLARN